MALNGPRERVPFKIYTAITGQGCRADLQLQANSASMRLHAPITFLVSGTRGIRLVDLVAHNGAGARYLDGAGDWVLGDVSYGVLKVHLTWPGYTTTTTTKSIDLYSSKSRMTRGGLAVQVGQLFARFLETCKSSKVHPSAAKWHVGEGGHGIHNVVLASLVNVAENVWQAEVEVLPKDVSD